MNGSEKYYCTNCYAKHHSNLALNKNVMIRNESNQVDRALDNNELDAITSVETVQEVRVIVHQVNDEALLETEQSSAPTTSLEEVSLNVTHNCDLCMDKFTTIDGLNENKQTKHMNNHHCHLCTIFCFVLYALYTMLHIICIVF